MVPPAIFGGGGFAARMAPPAKPQTSQYSFFTMVKPLVYFVRECISSMNVRTAAAAVVPTPDHAEPSGTGFAGEGIGVRLPLHSFA